MPTERRVKRWGLSVIELVRDPIGRQVLFFFYFLNVKFLTKICESDPYKNSKN